jgi:hypothetical protein
MVFCAFDYFGQPKLFYDQSPLPVKTKWVNCEIIRLGI